MEMTKQLIQVYVPRGCKVHSVLVIDDTKSKLRAGWHHFDIEEELGACAKSDKAAPVNAANSGE